MTKVSKKTDIEIQEKFISVMKELQDKYVERDEHIKAIGIAILAQRNVLFLGPPGVAKSALIRAWTDRVVESKYFEVLVTRFSTPDEIFGPVSGKELMENDRYVRATDNYLPTAHLGFIDEVFKSSSGCLNSLLTVMNERIFSQAGKPEPIPLFSLIGASNEVPEPEDGLDALFDRFHIKLKTNPISEISGFITMLNTNYEAKPENVLTLEEVFRAQETVKAIEVPQDTIELLAILRGIFRHNGFSISDRQWKQTKSALQATCYLRGGDVVEQEDFEFLQNMLWNDPDTSRKAASLLLDKINPDKNEVIKLNDNAIDAMQQLDKITDINNIMTEAISVAGKIKALKKDVDAIISRRKKASKPVEDMVKISNNMTKMITTVLVDKAGINLKQED